MPSARPPARPSAHASRATGHLVVRNALFGYAASLRRRDSPPWRYTDPELAEVGLTEPQAKREAQGPLPRRPRPLRRERPGPRDPRDHGLVKIVADRSGRILGAGIVGPAAGELISLFALAIAKNLTVADLESFVAPYPTLGEIANRLGDAWEKRPEAGPLARAPAEASAHVAIIGLALYDGAEMTAEPRAMPGPFSGLSVKLIATIVVVILAVEVVIYLPSVANFRADWLDNRLRIGIVAGRVLDAVPDVMALPRMPDRPPADVGRRPGHRLSPRRPEPADRARGTARCRARSSPPTCATAIRAG